MWAKIKRFFAAIRNWVWGSKPVVVVEVPPKPVVDEIKPVVMIKVTPVVEIPKSNKGLKLLFIISPNSNCVPFTDHYQSTPPAPPVKEAIDPIPIYVPSPEGESRLEENLKSQIEFSAYLFECKHKGIAKQAQKAEEKKNGCPVGMRTTNYTRVDGFEVTEGIQEREVNSSQSATPTVNSKIHYRY